MIALLLRYPDETLNESASLISPEMFDDDFCRLAWAAAEANVAQSKPVSIRALRSHSGLKKRSEDLRQCAGEAITAAHLTYHISEMVDLASRRKLQAIATMIDERIATASATQLAEEVMVKLTDSLGASEADDKRWKTAKDVMLETVTSIEESQARRGALIGYSTGIRSLNGLTGGLQAGRLYVIAGRPAKGKSVLGLQLASYACRHAGVAAGVFSLEMANHEIGQRLIATETGVNIGEIMNGVDDGTGKIGIARQQTYSKIMEAAATLAQTRLLFRDYATLTALSLRVETRKIVQTAGVKIILLDYLQLCQMRGNANDRRLAIGEITKTCKQLSKQYNLVFIVISQLGRSADGKQEMSLSQLADSDEIGRDADVVACINEDQDLDVVKNRSGPTGLIPLDFDGPTFQFRQASV
jgi:replicative DNA helicase